MHKNIKFNKEVNFMKFRTVLAILLFVIIGVVVALALSPEFCHWFQGTPILKDIYHWVDNNFRLYINEVTQGENKFFYISIIGVLIISLYVLILFKVKKSKSRKDRYIQVTATPIIKSNEEATIIVVEEN